MHRTLVDRPTWVSKQDSSTASTRTVRVVRTFSAVRTPMLLSEVTLRTVDALTLSPSAIRLNTCHMSSVSSGTITMLPAPSFSRFLWRSFMVPKSLLAGPKQTCQQLVSAWAEQLGSQRADAAPDTLNKRLFCNNLPKSRRNLPEYHSENVQNRRILHIIYQYATQFWQN